MNEREKYLAKLLEGVLDTLEKIEAGTYHQDLDDRTIGYQAPTIDDNIPGISTVYTRSVEGYNTAVLCTTCFHAHLVERYDDIAEAIVGHQKWVARILNRGSKPMSIVELGHPVLNVPDVVIKDLSKPH